MKLLSGSHACSLRVRTRGLGGGETGTHQRVPGGQEVLEDREDLEGRVVP